jgi:hypothetical protein
MIKSALSAQKHCNCLIQRHHATHGAVAPRASTSASGIITAAHPSFSCGTMSSENHHIAAIRSWANVSSREKARGRHPLGSGLDLRRAAG